MVYKEMAEDRREYQEKEEAAKTNILALETELSERKEISFVVKIKKDFTLSALMV